MNRGFSTSSRVVLLTYPGLYGAAALAAFAAVPGLDIVGVGLSDRVFVNKGYFATVATMLRRTGLRYTLYSFLVTDFAWAILRSFRRPRRLNRLGCRVRYLKNVNSRTTVEWVRTCEPDFVASCYFNQLIGREVAAVPRVACVNLHPALLPALRGPDSCFRALERGLKISGLTVHLIDATFDTGPILYQELRPIPPGASLLQLSLELWTAGGEVLGRWIAENPDRPNTARPQESALSDYASWPTAKEVQAFRRAGSRLFTASEFAAALRAVAKR